MSRRILVILAGLGLVACGSETHIDLPAPAPTYDYVALGDSYAAMGSTAAETTGPQYCLRSTDNYPSNVLADAQVTGRDVTCQGAVTGHLLRPRDAEGEVLPAQVEALSESTDLVTLSIGGNDIGFGDIVGCFLAAVYADRASDCATTWSDSVDSRLAELPSRLDEVYRAIDERSGGARVIATGYLPLLAQGDRCEEVGVLSDADRDWVIAVTSELNAVVAEAAQRHGAEMVLPEESVNHTGCADPERRWVDFFGSQTGAFPMHPTPTGQAVMADAVLATL